MIYIGNEQDKVEFTGDLHDDVIRAVSRTLEEEKVAGPVEVNVMIVDNERMQEINFETRQIDQTTDVLSFPMLDYPPKQVFRDLYQDRKFPRQYLNGESLVLGDVVLSLEKALEQSVEYGHSLRREVCFLVIHSMLHLLGYDHIVDDDKRVMRSREDEILGLLNIGRD